MDRAPTRNELGFSLLELLVVILTIALVLGMGAAAWNSYHRAGEAAATARLMKLGLDRARMLAVYRGVSHFVVVDPTRRTLTIVEDSSAPQRSYDSGDTPISTTRWSSAVSLDIPGQPNPLPRPLGAGNVAAAWDLPQPDSSAEWGTQLKGVMTTPDGKIMSAAATPQVVVFGTIVFNDPDQGERTVSVAVEGLSGTVRSYRLDGSTWKDI